MGVASTRSKETDSQLRKRLIDEAQDLFYEIECIESELIEKVHLIKKLNPTKKELENGVQDLMDCYYSG